MGGPQTAISRMSFFVSTFRPVSRNRTKKRTGRRCSRSFRYVIDPDQDLSLESRHPYDSCHRTGSCCRLDDDACSRARCVDDLAVAVEQSYVVDVRCAAAVRVEYDVARLRIFEVPADAVLSEFLILALSGSSCESLCVKSLDLRALVVYPVYESAAVERSRTCCAVYVSASLLRSRDLSYDRCRSLGESLCLRSELLRSLARDDL